jgi:hypothetical protein
MLKEALEYLRGIIDDGRKAYAFQAPGEPGHVYYIAQGDELHPRRAVPAPRAHRLKDVESLAALCKLHAPGLNHAGPCEGCEKACPECERRVTVWYSRAGVVALLDDQDRRDRAAMELQQSKQMETLAAWSRNVVWHDQPALIRILRTVFPGVSGGGELLKIVQVLRFKVERETEVETRPGGSSIGRKLKAEATGTDELPETTRLWVPAFEQDLGIMCNVRCALEADPAEGKVALIPLAGEVEEGWSKAEEDLGAQIHKAIGDTGGVHIFRGAP